MVSNIKQYELFLLRPTLTFLSAKKYFSSANATPEFEGRGGEQLANSISNMLQRAYDSKQAFNLKQFCILEGKQCWKLFVDILVSILLIL